MDKNRIDGLYTLEDLINLKELQQLLKEFSNLSHFTIELVTYPSLQTLFEVGKREICTHFHKANTKSKANCITNTLELIKKSDPSHTFSIQECKNGLVNAVIPISIENIHLGYLFSGQNLLSPPDKNQFIKQAQTYNYNQTEYIKALEKVPLTTKKELKKALSFMQLLIVSLAEKGLLRKRSEASILSQKKVNEEQQIKTAKEEKKRSQKEQEVSHLKEHNEALIQAIPDLIFVLNKKGDFLNLVASNNTKLFIPSHQFLGKNIVDVMPQEVAKQSLKALKYLFKTKEIQHYEYSLSKNKVINWFEVRFSLKGQNEAIAIIRNTTEQKLAEQRLEESKKKYKLITESLSECVFTMDKNNHFTYLSPAFETITHASFKDYLNQSYSKLIPEKYQQLVQEKFKNGINNNTKQSYELEIIRTDGTLVPIEINIQSLFEEDTKLIGYIGTFKDISKRKKSELKLIERESYFRQSFEKPTVIKVIVNPENGMIVKANQAAANFYGWSINQLEQMNITQLDIASNKIIQDKIKKIINSNVSSHFESTHIKSDHTIRNVDVYTTVIDVNNKKLIHAIIFDITDKKKAIQQAIILQKATEQNTNSIIITDTDANIEYVNSAFEKVSGYSIEELIGKNPRILHSGHQSQSFYQEMWSNLSSGEIWKGEILNKKKNGDLYWESIAITPILDDDQNIMKYIAIKDDITYKKNIEQALLRSKEKAEESDRLKTAFLQNMSHEIRTPLNSILGFSQILQNTNASPEEVQQYSEIISKSGTRLLDLINNILDISKIESGNLVLKEEAIQLNQLIQHIDKLISPRIKQKGLKLHLKFDLSDQDSLIQIDAGKLNQILLNLITNAIKFTEKGSITCSYKIVDDKILFCVKDTGPGIPRKQQSQVFGRFYQVDQTINKHFEGVGLGLAISKGLVELLRGDIWLESEIGKGTSFFFTIPYKNRQRHSPRKKTLADISTATNLNILIAEDDDSSFLFLEAILNQYNTKIHRATNGKQAVEISNDQDIDLVLMDINMPVMNGIEATKLIRQEHPKLPIIAQTAYAFSVEKKEVFEAGCNEYLAKPISQTDLISTISKWI